MKISCPICGGNQTYTVRKQIRNSDIHKVLKCHNCDLVFLSPLPDEMVLKDYYNEQYRIEYDGNTIEERFKSDLDEAEIRLDRLGALLSPGIDLLEIGSGSGAFLKKSSDSGANVTGIEYDLIAQEWINKKLNLKNFESLDMLPTDQRFELIVMFHVLEHVADPIKFITDIAERLKPTGTIVIEVPNIDDALLSIYGLESFKEFYFSIAHLTYFSPNTLQRVTDAANLVGEISCIARYGFNNHLNWIKTGMPSGINPTGADFSTAFQTLYDNELIKLQQADTIWAIMAKNQK